MRIVCRVSIRLTKCCTAGLRSVFEQFDKNKDGVLERGEFRRGLFLLKAGLSAVHIAELMQARDVLYSGACGGRCRRDKLNRWRFKTCPSVFIRPIL